MWARFRFHVVDPGTCSKPVCQRGRRNIRCKVQWVKKTDAFRFNVANVTVLLKFAPTVPSAENAAAGFDRDQFQACVWERAIKCRDRRFTSKPPLCQGLLIPFYNHTCCLLLLQPRHALFTLLENFILIINTHCLWTIWFCVEDRNRDTPRQREKRDICSLVGNGAERWTRHWVRSTWRTSTVEESWEQRTTGWSCPIPAPIYPFCSTSWVTDGTTCWPKRLRRRGDRGAKVEKRIDSYIEWKAKLACLFGDARGVISSP